MKFCYSMNIKMFGISGLTHSVMSLFILGVEQVLTKVLSVHVRSLIPKLVVQVLLMTMSFCQFYVCVLLWL
jgi:hypothetical protein